MKTLLCMMCLGAALSLTAAEPAGCNKKVCTCIKCECTPENHCGCLAKPNEQPGVDQLCCGKCRK